MRVLLQSLRFFRNSIFWPLSFIWEAIYRIRRIFYKYGIFSQKFFRIPILSVGNITFGGTGKTPLTIWIAEFLQEKGMRPLVLMRGYKGALEYSAGLIKGGNVFRSPPVYFGDEPLLIAKRLKVGGVVVGKKRGENLNFYYDQVEPHVVILDDGFQHLQIHRNFDILLFDASVPLSRYKTPPFGSLREGMSSLKDAQAVILGHSDQVTEEKLSLLQTFLSKYLPDNVLFAHIRYLPTGLFNIHDNNVYAPGDVKGKKVLAVAAIGAPNSFFQSLESLGLFIVYKMVFPDHYYYSEADLKKILDIAEDYQVDVITTEKDIMKMRRLTFDERILYLGIKVDFLRGEELLREKIYQVALKKP